MFHKMGYLLKILKSAKMKIVIKVTILMKGGK